MEALVGEHNKSLEIDINGEEFLNLAAELAAADPSFAAGLEGILAGKFVEEVCEETMSKEDFDILQSSNFGMTSKELIEEKINDMQLRQGKEDFIKDVVAKFDGSENLATSDDVTLSTSVDMSFSVANISAGVQSLNLPDSKVGTDSI